MYGISQFLRLIVPPRQPSKQFMSIRDQFVSIRVRNNVFSGWKYFPHEVRFSAAIGAAHFLADLRNAALSAFEEGAPFMGTALAAYKQCIGAEVVCIFT